jgi:hypothetical protein
LRLFERKLASPLSLKAGVVCEELRWQSVAINRGGKVPLVKAQSAKATLAPNPSFERTPYSQVRWL